MEKQKENGKGKNIFLFGMMLLMVSLVGLVSAVTCTGESCPVTVNINIGNDAPTIDFVSAPTTVTLNGGTTKTIYITFNASDGNGYADLVSPSVQVYKAGETTRTASVCNAVENSTQTTVFNCTVDMEYYDGVGVWNVNASVSDVSTSYVENTTVTTTVNALDYFSGDLASISGWSSAQPGSNDVGGASIILSNTGNSDYNTFTITGYNATGVVGFDVIPAGSFSVYNETGATSGQEYMVDSTAVDVTTVLTIPPHGENSTEEIFFYVDLSASLAYDSYISDASWSIQLSAV